MRSGYLAAGLSMALGLGTPLAGSVLGASGGDGQLQAHPSVFVGTAAQCGGQAGNNIVSAFWLSGMGLPDDGTTPNASPTATKQDRQEGLLLNKNGPTPTCSAAGATITGLRKGATISELRFDRRRGDHCGAGAPRFNVTTTDGRLFFVGCAAGTKGPAPQDPTEWERVAFDESDFFPASGSSQFFYNSTQVRSIEIIFDEGTDTALSPDDPAGVGLAVLDNININGELIAKGPGPGGNP
jgi:hypothetical protein